MKFTQEHKDHLVAELLADDVKAHPFVSDASPKRNHKRGDVEK